MIYKLSDEELSVAWKGENLFDILKKKGAPISRIKKNKWELNEKIIFKNNEIFNEFGIKKSLSHRGPQFSILDEANKSITIVKIRNQSQSGSVDEKIPYGNFMRYDYNKVYKEHFTGYDIDVAFILNKHFDDAKYNSLLEYVSLNQLKIWHKEIKI